MTFIEAAAQVLASAGEPLHYEEIYRRALALGLITTNGATPEVSMGSRLYTVTKQDDSLFERHGKGIFGLAPPKRKGVDALVAEANARTRTQLHELLAQVPPKRFEALIMELLLEMGFDENTLEITPYAKDGGVDVFGTYSAAGLAPVNAAVQVKRWKSNIQSPTVTQLRGSLQVHQAGIIITTGDFTKSAREEAGAQGKTRISLINGEQLVSLLIKHHIGVKDEPLVVTQLDVEWWGEVLGEANEIVVAPVEQAQPPAKVAPSSSAKPSGVIVLDAEIPVTTWKAALLAVADEMAKRHPEEFATVAPIVRGRKRQYLSNSPAEMIAPETVGSTGLWLETNQSERSVRVIAVRILEAFGYAATDVEFVVG